MSEPVQDLRTTIGVLLHKMEGLVRKLNDGVTTGEFYGLFRWWAVVEPSANQLPSDHQVWRLIEQELMPEVDRIVASGGVEPRPSRQIPDLVLRLGDVLERIGRDSNLGFPFNSERTQQMIENMIDSVLMRREAQLEQLAKSSEIRMSELDNSVQRANDLLAEVGEKGGAVGYARFAQAGQRERVFWQKTTVVAFGLWLFFACLAYAATFDQPATTGLALRNLAIGLPFALVCGFGAIQVARCNRFETSNRRLHLQLRSMEPLLAGLTPQQKGEVRSLVVPHFLSGSDHDNRSATSEDAVLMGRLFAMVEQLTKK